MTTSTIILLFVSGLVLLILGAELLVRGASSLAVAVGISPLVVGMTVVAYGTSAPEVAVTVQAMYAEPAQPDLAIGNVVGSNISNVLLVLGLAAIAVPLVVSRTLVRVTVPIMIAVTGLIWWMSWDGAINRWEGILLLIGAILFSVISVARSRRATAAARQHREPHSRSPWQTAAGVMLKLTAIVVGLIMLVIGAQKLIEGATEVARLLKVSELIVGLTVVAVGTSLPEIATSLVASLRGHGDLAVGNVVGSNIFNLLLVLGLCATVSPQAVTVPSSALQFDIPVMFFVSLACWPIFFTNWQISRWEGFALLGTYVAYVFALYLIGTGHGAAHNYVAALTYGFLPIATFVLLLLTARHGRQESLHNQIPLAAGKNDADTSGTER